MNDPSIDVVVELIGGVEPAWEYISTAIKNGKHIVTANKELLAKKGEELFKLAEEHNKVVLYEAANCWWYSNYHANQNNLSRQQDK